MADFYQTGLVATVHRLGSVALEKIEADLLRYSRVRPIALVLPSLASELEQPALKGILEELKKVRFLKQIVVTMGGTDAEQFRQAKKVFGQLPQKPAIIWNTGPRVEVIYQKLEANGLPVGGDGKGRSCWLAYGYILACEQCDVIALHDCDIVNYSREMLARLCYPVVNPNIDFEFCKAFYARVTDRMHGRVTRLLVTPLIRALWQIVGYQRILHFLDSFRYALAGEFAMHVDLARINRIPNDWGLEIGVLAEVYRNSAIRRVCQVDISDNYEHKHQALSADDPQKGLMRMSVDISKALFRILAAEGIELTPGRLKTLLTTYVRTAQDTISRYYADAKINGLQFDRHEEEVAVNAFAQAIRLAQESFFEDPLGAPQIPNWSRVSSALPDFLEELKAAVEADNAEN
jgi:glucosyl-3-phosphoglycerate synthase